MIPKSGYRTVFSNNWISFHENGDAALYPMFAVNRRSGVGGNFGYVRGKGFKTENIVDYTSAEDGFSWRNRKLTPQSRMKSILRFVSSLMRTVY
jgi:hypothetical protein